MRMDPKITAPPFDLFSHRSSDAGQLVADSDELLEGAVIVPVPPRRRRHRCAAAPDQRDRARQVRHQRRHRTPTRPIFGTSERFWLNLQSRYELERNRLAGTLDQIEPLATAENRPLGSCLTRASHSGQQGPTRTPSAPRARANHQLITRFPRSQHYRPVDRLPFPRLRARVRFRHPLSVQLTWAGDVQVPVVVCRIRS